MYVGSVSSVIPINTLTNQAGTQITVDPASSDNVTALTLAGSTMYVGGVFGSVYPINTFTNTIGSGIRVFSSTSENTIWASALGFSAPSTPSPHTGTLTISGPYADMYYQSAGGHPMSIMSGKPIPDLDFTQPFIVIIQSPTGRVVFSINLLTQTISPYSAEGITPAFTADGVLQL